VQEVSRKGRFPELPALPGFLPITRLSAIRTAAFMCKIAALFFHFMGVFYVCMQTPVKKKKKKKKKE
jgi:hypothetical protein